MDKRVTTPFITDPAEIAEERFFDEVVILCSPAGPLGKGFILKGGRAAAKALFRRLARPDGRKIQIPRVVVEVYQAIHVKVRISEFVF